ncbi:MAG: YaeQ family protein [Chromatocurvus sp.]
MAPKSAVFRLTLQLADLDRQLYRDFPLTIARHPSETDARMMLRVLAFALHADDPLAFGRGISNDDEPDLWLRALDGRIETWIELGAPDPDRLRKACGRSNRVLLYAYGDLAMPVWLRKHDTATVGPLCRCCTIIVLRQRALFQPQTSGNPARNLYRLRRRSPS